MDQQFLRNKFADIGVNVRFVDLSEDRRALTSNLPIDIDVAQNRRGEEVVVSYEPDRDFNLTVLDARPKDRHLLLMLKYCSVTRRGASVKKVRFLCGHDERHYFVCGIPDDAKVSTVREAKLALLPRAFLAAHAVKKGKPRDLLKRRNATGVRQGEWLFVRVDGFEPQEPALVRRNEPIVSRPRSKPHICEELYAKGGETVYYHPRFAPRGMTEDEYRAFKSDLQSKGRRVPRGFQARTRGAEVFARGCVRHPDHRTVVLRQWHRVLMNREGESRAARAVAFLD